MSFIEAANVRKDFDCSICLEVIQYPSTLGCGHSFCLECILAWNAKQPLCPLCKRTITADRSLLDFDLEAKIAAQFADQLGFAPVQPKIGEGALDSHWGCLDSNLLAQGRSPAEIQALKERFSAAFLDLDQPIQEWMCDLYRLTIPADSEQHIAALRRQLEAEANSWIRKAYWSEVSDEELKAFAEDYESKVKQFTLLEKPSYLPWFYYSMEFNSAKSEQLFDIYWDSFRQGHPGSFALIARLLSDGKFNYTSLCHKEPFKEIATTLRWLERLSDLGVREAQYQLSCIYVHNSIRSDQLKQKLAIPLDARIAKIEHLALEKRHKHAQYEYGFMLYHQSLGSDPIHWDRDRIERGFQRLIAGENGCAFYVTCYYADNGSRAHNAGLSDSQRLEALSQRAVKGDQQSFNILINALLHRGFKPKRKEPYRAFDLTQAEIWTLLQDLKPLDPHRWHSLVGKAYQSKNDAVLPKLSDQQIHEWILTNAKDGGGTRQNKLRS